MNSRAGKVTTRSPSSARRAPACLVRAAVREQAPPAVALVARQARGHGLPEDAGELLGELAGGVEELLGPGVQRLRVDAVEQLAGAVAGEDGGAQVALQSPAEPSDKSDHVQGEHGRQLPALPLQRGGDEQPDRALDALDGLELRVGQRQPGLRGDPPAAQIAGVERVGAGERPA